MDRYFMFGLRDKPEQIEKNRKAFGLPFRNLSSKASDSHGDIRKLFGLQWKVNRKNKYNDK